MKHFDGDKFNSKEKVRWSGLLRLTGRDSKKEHGEAEGNDKGKIMEREKDLE